MTHMKKYPIRLTPQRLAILEYLEGNKAHPSASDIYKAVSKKHPMMSFATVYNTLETLRGKKHVRELSIDPEKKRFDPNSERYGYEITGTHVDFYGVCPKCKRGRSSKI